MRFEKSAGLSLAVVLSLLAVSLPELRAQTSGTGAIEGTITDATGGVIPNAAVTATNLDTGQTRATTTGADGGFKFALIPPGNYRLSIAAAGFKTEDVPSVSVAVTETPVVNRSLQVGGQTEQVTIEANAETIQTTTSTMGTVVGTSTVAAIPLTTRNYTNILALSTGTNGSVNNATSLGRGGMELAVNGNSTSQNDFQMDGVSVTNFGSSGLSIESGSYPTFGIPNPDTLQEFKIQTSLYDAGYGRNPGANVNVITKSGSNSFHGTAFEFFRNVDLNANDFFVNRSGQAKPVLNQNQFGGVLGGPIKKDKLFFFGSYQQTWQKNGAASQGFSSGITLVPIPQGDRSAPSFQAALGAAFCNSKTNPGGAGAGAGMQVACDGSNINPIAMKFLQAKTATGAYFIPSSAIPGANQPGVTYSEPAYDKEYQTMFNVDYLLNSKNTLSSRYYFSHEPQTINFVGAGVLPGDPATDTFGYQNGVLKLTTILTNNLVNEARSSVQRTTSDAFQHPPTSTYAAAVGMIPLGPTLPFAPVLSFQGLFTAGGSAAFDESPHNTEIQWADQISWTHGKQTIRAGLEYERVFWNWDYYGLSRGIEAFQTFSDFLIGLPGGCGPAVVGVCNGSAYSNILNTSNFSVRSSPSGIVHGYRATNGNSFVQDDVKLTRRLTLNFGVRWEYDGLMSDTYGNAVNLSLAAVETVPVPGTSPATATAAGWVVPSNYSTSTWGPLPPGVIRAKTIIPNKNPVPLDDFAPRFGFAWQPIGDKFVVRGGYGFFFDRVSGNNIGHAIEQSPPYAITLDQTASTNQFASEFEPFQSTPLGTFPTRWVNFANVTGSNLSQSYMADNFVTPLVYSYNLNIQYQLARQWLLEVGYVGSHGIHQSEALHIINEALLASPNNPINGVTTNTVANSILRVPYLGFGPTGLQQADTDGDFKFNSLQATLRKQLSHGLSFQAAYTWARAFGNETFPGTGAANGGANLGDPNNLTQQYGLNPQYRPQRLIINYTYMLPGDSLKGWANRALAGWNISGVTTIQDGQPLSITDSRGGGIFGMSGATALVISRAEMAAGATYADIATSGSLGQRLGGATGGSGYFNPAAFTTIPIIGGNGTAGTGGTGWGDSGVGVILGPGQFNFDASISKQTRVGGINENGLLQFRAEFFNFFNHPQFNTPANNLSLGNFGQITSTSVNPRLVQLALKYVF